MLKRTHTCGELRAEHIGQQVVVSGWVAWVANWRDHGGLVFIDLRDRYGAVQVVFNPESDEELHGRANSLRSEYCVSVQGAVRKRPEGMANPALATGEIEVHAQEMQVHCESKTPPFEIDRAGNVSMEVRLQNRVLDLRRPEMQRNLIFRHRLLQLTRRFFDEEGFIEVETPFLTKSTPEGARDFLVPSRLNPGAFYALPQSPQLFKQVLMVSGLDRYFQIVRCFRDEDLRADRQPEFTQIDLEMSFVDESDVMACTERLMARAFGELLGRELRLPLPRLKYTEALQNYGTDAPDLRFGLHVCEISDVAKTCGFNVFRAAVEAGGQVRGICVPDGASLPRSEVDGLVEWVKQLGAKGLAWFKIEDGKPTSGIAKFFSEGELEAITKKLGASDGDLLLFIADKAHVCNLALSHLRGHLARKLGLIEEGRFELCWITECPAFEINPQTGGLTFLHHPFTSPCEGDLERLESDPTSVRSRAYDLVMNGGEMGGGSIRISDAELQLRVLGLLGFSREEAEDRFGFLLNALRYGAPPHGGIAFGFDRIVAGMLGLDDIRETIAFPKTQRASCPLTGAPAAADPEQLRELGISLVE